MIKKKVKYSLILDMKSAYNLLSRCKEGILPLLKLLENHIVCLGKQQILNLGEKLVIFHVKVDRISGSIWRLLQQFTKNTLI